MMNALRAAVVWSLLVVTPVVAEAPLVNKSADPSSAAETTGTETIIDIASSTPFFHTLVEGLTAADLLPQLKRPGPYTIFAPNDAAFAKLGPDAVKNLLKPENKTKLRTLLAYHIVPKKLTSDDLHPGQFKTLTGEEITIKATAGGPTVNGAKILDVDMEGSNGVIHIIDTVLTP